MSPCVSSSGDTVRQLNHMWLLCRDSLHLGPRRQQPRQQASGLSLDRCFQVQERSRLHRDGGLCAQWRVSVVVVCE